MNICFSYDHLFPATNRAGRHIETLLRRFHSRGHHVSALTTPVENAQDPEGLDLLRLREAPGVKGHTRSDALLTKAITRFLKQGQVQVLFAEGLTPLTTIAVKAAQRAGAKTIVRVLADAQGIVYGAGSDRRLAPSILKKRIGTMLDYADAAAASSVHCADLLKEYYSKEIRVIEKCVDLNVFKYTRVTDHDLAEFRDKFQLGSRPILIYGREEMRADTILGTIPLMLKLVRRIPDIVYLIVGQIDQPQRVIHAVNAANLGVNYRLTGPLSQREQFAAYCASELYVAPFDSRASESELLEAMAMRCAIACYGPKVESARTVLLNSNALVLDDNDDTRAAEEIAALLEDSPRLHALQEHALDTARAKDIGVAVNEVEKLCEQMLGLQPGLILAAPIRRDDDLEDDEDFVDDLTSGGNNQGNGESGMDNREREPADDLRDHGNVGAYSPDESAGFEMEDDLQDAEPVETITGGEGDTEADELQMEAADIVWNAGESQIESPIEAPDSVDENSLQEEADRRDEGEENDRGSSEEDDQDRRSRRSRRRRGRRRLRHETEDGSEGGAAAAPSAPPIRRDSPGHVDEVPAPEPLTPVVEVSPPLSPQQREEEFLQDANRRLRELDPRLTLKDLLPFLRPPKDLFILSVASGAGQHRAGEALFETFKSFDQNLRVRQINIMDFIGRSYSAAEVEAVLDELRQSPAIFGNQFETGVTAGVEHPEESRATFFENVFDQKLRTFVLEKRPHQIVLTHFLPLKEIAKIKKEHELRLKLSVVITDYDYHPYWLAEGVDLYLAPTEKVRFKLQRAGVPAANIEVVGIPVHPRFDTEIDREAVRRALGVRGGVPTLLLRPGGIGATESILETIDCIANVNTPFNLLVLCGKNESLVEAIRSRNTPRHVSVKAFGFVSNIHEVMGISDLMITRAAGHTVAEAFSSGVPMVLLRPTPGVEERTADWFVERGVALKAHDSVDLEWIVADLLRNNARALKEMRDAAYAGRPKDNSAKVSIERITRQIH